MFYDPSKSTLQMLKNACECRCESYECVANETRMQNMGITNKRLISIIHITGVSLCLISARPCPISLFLQVWTYCPHSPCILRKCQYEASEFLQMSSDHLQTSYDHYKCLAINKNGLRLLKICCEYAFITNIRSMFLIFARPRECLRTPQEC